MNITLPRRCADYRHRYPGQFRYQSAYIEFDPEDGGSLRADWNGEIGNAIPFAVYYGRLFRFSVPVFAKLRDVRRVMKEIAPMCEEYTASFETRWNGSNMVGAGDDDLLEKIRAHVYYAFGEEE